MKIKHIPIFFATIRIIMLPIAICITAGCSDLSSQSSPHQQKTTEQMAASFRNLKRFEAQNATQSHLETAPEITTPIPSYTQQHIPEIPAEIVISAKDVAKCKEAIRLRPDSEKSYFDLGYVYGELGLYRKAIDNYLLAVHFSPNYVDALYNLGSAYANIGQFDKAIATYKKVVVIDPTDDVYRSLGMAYTRLDETKQAIEICNQEISSDPKHFEAYFRLGLIYKEIDDHNKATLQFLEVIKLEPKHGQAYYYLANSYRHNKLYQKAIDAYQQAISLSANLGMSHYELGVTYLDINSTNEAMIQYRSLKNVDKKLAMQLFNQINL